MQLKAIKTYHGAALKSQNCNCEVGACQDITSVSRAFSLGLLRCLYSFGVFESLLSALRLKMRPIQKNCIMIKI